MNRRDFVKKVTDVLRKNDIKKPVSIPKQVFTISDNEGNTRDFSVKKTNKKVIYTLEDVSAIVDACLEVAMDSLKRGEEVNIHGFGALGLKYREERWTKSVRTGEKVIIEGHYVPKFSFGKTLRMCAKIYELSLKDRLEEPEPIYDETDGIEGELETYGN